MSFLIATACRWKQLGLQTSKIWSRESAPSSRRTLLAWALPARSFISIYQEMMKQILLGFKIFCHSSGGLAQGQVWEWLRKLWRGHHGEVQGQRAAAKVDRPPPGIIWRIIWAVRLTRTTIVRGWEKRGNSVVHARPPTVDHRPLPLCGRDQPGDGRCQREAGFRATRQDILPGGLIVWITLLVTWWSWPPTRRPALSTSCWLRSCSLGWSTRRWWTCWSSTTATTCAITPSGGWKSSCKEQQHETLYDQLQNSCERSAQINSYGFQRRQRHTIYQENLWSRNHTSVSHI